MMCRNFQYLNSNPSSLFIGDQQRFEDYLELEQYLEELQAGHVAHLPTALTSRQAPIYRMVALFRSVVPDETELRPEFIAALQACLEQELQRSRKTHLFPLRHRKFFRASRRAILIGG